MKKITTLVLLLLALPFYAQWTAQNSGTSEDLNDVSCISESFVMAVGNAGTILKTTDGGVNWTAKPSNTTADLRKIEFANATVGYAVGTDGKLLKTNDGGETWSGIDTGNTLGLFGLSVVDENILYISGENGLLKKSINGGNSFTSHDLANVQTVWSVQFLSEQVGYASVGGLLKTINGGESWTEVTDAWIRTFHFIDADTGFINTESGMVKTIDGGVTLNFVDFPFYMVVDVFATSPNAVWGVEDTAPLCGCEGFCIKKGNILDGEFENLRNCNLSPGFKSIYFANQTTGYTVGIGGAIFKNTTGTMLSVDETPNQQTATIYPNPATDFITIATRQTAGPIDVMITDALGKTVYSGSHGAADSVTINLEGFSTGMYFVSLLGQKTTETQKIMIR